MTGANNHRKELETNIEIIEQEIELLARVLNRFVYYGGVPDGDLKAIRDALAEAEEKCNLLEIELIRLEDENV